MKDNEKSKEDPRGDLKDLANGKSSKDCTFEEGVAVYRAMKPKGRIETDEERRDRINRFRCGW